MTTCRELIILSLGLVFDLSRVEIKKVHKVMNNGTTLRARDIGLLVFIFQLDNLLFQ